MKQMRMCLLGEISFLDIKVSDNLDGNKARCFRVSQMQVPFAK